MSDYENMNPEDPSLIEQYKTNVAPNTTVNAPGILALGVGGGGCNAVAYMSSQEVRGVDFVALNTDEQALAPMQVPTKILLGPKICGGFGAGGRADLGRKAAEESVPEIDQLFTDKVQMVFVTAGMGGGTGTGAAPVVAGVAKKRGILTVGIVTIPFFFEGIQKITSAIEGAQRLQANVDAMLIINNDRLATIYPDMEWENAFKKADDILTTAARTISDMVTVLANINIDMRDVDTCLRNGRTALISVGYGEGEGRMSQAMRGALHSPLLCDTDIMNAKELLFAFYYSHNIEPRFKVVETSEVNNLVTEINKSVHVKFGWGFDDSLGNKIKFTILASGFDVSVSAGGTKVDVIAGADNDTTSDNQPNNIGDIAVLYGEDRVKDLVRRQETQSYYILSADDLDSDEAIAKVEASPAYKRDKRRVEAAPDQPRKDAPAAPQQCAPRQNPANNNSSNISFDINDR